MTTPIRGDARRHGLIRLFRSPGCGTPRSRGSTADVSPSRRPALAPPPRRRPRPSAGCACRHARRGRWTSRASAARPRPPCPADRTEPGFNVTNTSKHERHMCSRAVGAGWNAPSVRGSASNGFAGQPLVGLTVPAGRLLDDRRAAGPAPAARGPTRSRPASRGRTACRTTAAVPPGAYPSAGQNRDESGVQTSSIRISSPSQNPNSNFVSARMIPRSSAIAAARS